MNRWALQRQIDGIWIDTGEIFEGSLTDANAYAAVRATEDGWAYRIKP